GFNGISMCVSWVYVEGDLAPGPFYHLPTRCQDTRFAARRRRPRRAAKRNPRRMLHGTLDARYNVATEERAMGMDVYGRKPTSEAGKYFRANVWSWSPIHSLIVELCSDLLDEKTLRLLAFNDGAGPKGQKICTEMANRFERWMEHHTEGLRLESDLRVTKEGRLVGEEELAKDPDLETESPFEVADEHLKKWIEFLRNCGGFRVW